MSIGVSSSSLMRRLEVDLAAAEEDAVVAAAALVPAERPHPPPLPAAAQLALAHVLHHVTRAQRHLELHLAHAPDRVLSKITFSCSQV